MRNPPVNLPRWVVLAAIMSARLLLLGNRPLLERVLVVHIPASAIMFIVPTAVTVVEAYRLGRFRDVRQILGFARSDLGIVPGAIAIPFVATAVDQWIQGNAFPDNRGYMMVLGSIVAFMIAAALEELGSNAWLLRGLAGRTNVIAASLIVGGLWAIWHVIP